MGIESKNSVVDDTEFAHSVDSHCSTIGSFARSSEFLHENAHGTIEPQAFIISLSFLDLDTLH